jgi:hypothetical protein
MQSNSGDTKMLKSLIAALALSTLAIIGVAGAVQAAKCPPPGSSIKGCIHTPTAPQPQPPSKN